jgi:hypothetical protein
MATYTNLYATIGTSVPHASEPQITRYHWNYVQFANFTRVWPFKPGEYSSSSFYPSGVDYAIFMVPIVDTGELKPTFMTTEAFTELQKAPSGFLSANKSIMPAIVFPSMELCNNGVNDSANQLQVDPVTYGACFNWDVFWKVRGAVGETAVNSSDTMLWVSTANEGKAAYGYLTSEVCQRHDTVSDLNNNTLVLKLESPATFPTPASTNYSTTSMVGGGSGGAACAFTLKLRRRAARGDTTANDNANQARLSLLMGSNIDVSIDAETGVMMVDIGNQKTTASLVRTESDRKPGQALVPETMTLLMYPVWNGIVVSSGVQDRSSLVDSASTYCIADKSKDMLDYLNPQLDDFDFAAPVPIVVDYNSGTSVRVDWGTNLMAVFEACSGIISYTPAFFFPTCKFSVFFLANEDTETNTYEYTAFPVYSMNGVGATTVSVANSGIAESIVGSGSGGMEYRKFTFTVDSTAIGEWKRRGPEVFGYILRSKEVVDLDIDNANGTFSLPYSGGAVSGASWSDYITKISVSTGIDGTTGTITLDKYAMAGQTDYPDQAIGAVSININGGISPSTDTPIRTGRIFTGLAMGVNDNTSEGSDTWTIQLYGLEKKLEDIKLVNAPFWDGDQIGGVADWLSKYGGLATNWTYGTRTVELPRSTDFESPYVNFVLGTSVLEALRSIADMALHRFCIQKDGYGYFYSADNDYNIPDVIRTGSSTLHTFNSTVVETRDNTPSFENLYNTFATVGVESIGSIGGRDFVPQSANVVPGVFFSKVTNEEPRVPWSKLFVWSEQGVFTHTDLEAEHQRNMKRGGRTYQLTGGMTIAGNADIMLFDRVSADGTIWYVESVAHEVDLVAKTWRTTLGLGRNP